MSARIVAGLALADFRDRVRRPAYVVTLLAAVGLGYVAAPDADARWVVMYIGNHRGIYNSAYIGTLIAFASALWLTLGGFYIVRNAVSRDESTGVGELLAATPVRKVTYLAGKLLSNCMILASMVGVLALTAGVLQFARGESRTIEPLELVTPFVLIALPLVVLTAGAALLFETIPLLRSGLGNILWFLVWIVIAIGGQGPGMPFGGIGVHAAARSMRDAMIDQGIDVSGGGFSLGLVYLDKPLQTFVWDGMDVTTGFVGGRVALALIAVAVALLPAFWFARFDPARTSGQPTPAGPGGAEPNSGVPVLVGAAPMSTTAVRTTSSTTVARPRTVPRYGWSSGRLLTGEVKILVQGVSRWWWLGALCLNLIGLLMPIGGVILVVLPLAWIWPILIWSRLGTQRIEYGVDTLLAAHPWGGRRLLAEWQAGVILTVLAAAAPAVRMAIATDWPGLAAWAGGCLFIPSLALLLGTVSRSHRLFQALYLVWWYAIINGISFLDFMGTVRDDGRPAGPHAALVVAAAAGMVVLSFLAGSARRNLRV